MRVSVRVNRHPLCLCLAAALGCVVAGGSVLAAPPPTTEQAQAKKQLRDVRSKMESLGKQQADTAARRDTFNADLARKANAVSRVARALRETDTAIAAGAQQLTELQQQQAQLQSHLAGQRTAIAQLLRATYALGRGSDMRLLLGDEDVARISRALVYSTYFQRDRVQRVQRLMSDLATLQQVETEITGKQQALQVARTERAAQAGTLAGERAAQQKLVAQANAEYQDQAARLTALKQDAQALDTLVATLQKAVEDAAREERARVAAARAAAAKDAARTPRPGRRTTPPPPIEVASAGANIRGNLPWPASGPVTSYGNGVLIKAAGGSDVHAVARGKVIYAGFLRGYGLLLILNHGGGWLSMYGNNEALLHNVGDQVDVGTVLGTASPPTGINTGAYFELRQNNQPVDPRRWLGSRR